MTAATLDLPEVIEGLSLPCEAHRDGSACPDPARWVARTVGDRKHFSGRASLICDEHADGARQINARRPSCAKCGRPFLITLERL